MPSLSSQTAVTSTPTPDSLSEHTVAQLVAQVYEAAPSADRTRLLACLMRPLGVLSLMAVANGLFARLRFQPEWPELPTRLQELQSIQAADVAHLASRVQQVSLQALDGLAHVVSTSPALAGSATAALLLSVLMQRRGQHQAREPEDEDSFGLAG